MANSFSSMLTPRRGAAPIMRQPVMQQPGSVGASLPLSGRGGMSPIAGARPARTQPGAQMPTVRMPTPVPGRFGSGGMAPQNSQYGTIQAALAAIGMFV